MDETEWRDFRLNQQAQGTILARLQLELETHLEEAAVQAEQHAKYLMDPEAGVVVRTGRQQDALEQLASIVGRNGANADRVPGLEVRVGAIEQARKDEAAASKESKQWTWRQVIVPFACVVAALVLERLIDRWMAG